MMEQLTDLQIFKEMPKLSSFSVSFHLHYNIPLVFSVKNPSLWAQSTLGSKHFSCTQNEWVLAKEAQSQFYSIRCVYNLLEIL